MIRQHVTIVSTIKSGWKYYQGKMKFKPSGIWYGIDDSWLEWCYTVMPEWIKKNLFILEVDLSDILIISTPEELNAFCKKYEKVDQFNFNSIFGMIDWWKLSREYKGIELQNYHALKYGDPSNNIFRTWLHGWDVNGGCIWNTTALVNIKKTQTPNKWFEKSTMNAN